MKLGYKIAEIAFVTHIVRLPSGIFMGNQDMEYIWDVFVFSETTYTGELKTTFCHFKSVGQKFLWGFYSTLIFWQRKFWEI